MITDPNTLYELRAGQIVRQLGAADAIRIVDPLEPARRIALPWPTAYSRIATDGTDARAVLDAMGYIHGASADSAPYGLAPPVLATDADGYRVAYRAALPEPEPEIDERTDDEIRAELHSSRRARRTAAELSGFMHADHPVDSDRDSILRITNAATAALSAAAAGQPFAVVWSCADGYQMPLDVTGLLALQGALAMHGAACHARAQALAAAIDAAPDRDSLLSLDLSLDWPGAGL